MADYSRYKTETLEKMRDKAYDKYYELTTKPSGNWGDGMRLSKLPQNKEWERSKEHLDAIEKELERRNIEVCNLPESQAKQIQINFGNIISEMKDKEINLVFIQDNNGIFIEDNKGNFYEMELYYWGSYLDKLINNNVVVKYNLVQNEIKIPEWQKKVWNVSDVENFIERQHLNYKDNEQIGIDICDDFDI